MATQYLRNVSEQKNIILGSSSQWRRSVLERSGIRISDVCAPNIDEKSIRADTPEETACKVAMGKLDALVPRVQHCDFLICSDQVTVCEGAMREKPESEEEARLFLKSYSDGSCVTCINVLVVRNMRTEKVSIGSKHVTVHYLPMSQAVIDEAVKGSAVYTCAGGFTVDVEPLKSYVAKIVGGQEQDVMGMPLDILEKLMKEVES
eukprot:Platyproteum_vivax@DN16111_c0_g1_i1.p1